MTPAQPRSSLVSPVRVPLPLQVLVSADRSHTRSHVQLNGKSSGSSLRSSCRGCRLLIQRCLLRYASPLSQGSHLKLRVFEEGAAVPVRSACRVLFKMYASDINSYKSSFRDEGVCVLSDLVSLGYVGIEV